MAPATVSERHRSSATPLALVYAALVLYASLYPFAGWRWPPGQGPLALLHVPWTHWFGGFDAWANGLGYAPLGALACIAALRSGWRKRSALLLACAGPAALSYGTEVLQHFLPRRVPAMEDLLMNSGGAAGGALLAMGLHAIGLVGRWHALRDRWVAPDSAGALALLALWPIGLLFPAPVPLGLGQVGDRLREWLAELLQDVPWAGPVYEMLAVPPPPPDALRPLSESLIVALGLLAPCLLAYSVMPPGWRRVWAALGAGLIAAGAMTLSTVLNFGPGHGWAWIAPSSATGFVLGLVLAGVAAPAPRRMAVGLGLMAISGLVVGVSQAPADPYFAQSLQAWEQGRFVRFHGLSQWVGWLWPYVAMAWLLSRLGAPRYRPRP